MNFSDYAPKISGYLSKIKVPQKVEDNVLWGYGCASRWIQPTLNKIANYDFNINEVCTGVYIGDFSSACKVDELKKQGITHIVTAISGVGEMYPNDFTYYVVEFDTNSFVGKLVKKQNEMFP